MHPITPPSQGTIFVLVKDQPPRQRLLEAIERGASDDEVSAAVAALEQEPGAEAVAAPARSQLAQGSWRLRWSQQAADANPLQKALAGNVRNGQIIGDGRLDNVVSFAPMVTLRATAACRAMSDTRTGVNIDGVQLELGPWKCVGVGWPVVVLNAYVAQGAPWVGAAAADGRRRLH